ncbi:unnamed protein product [marine sediment metagenome]|uniref:Major facilitator superfamily (MFS) profile domain-containing protein n=1 Tax=marine sediment metagenome TaxID=412755 RepID=X1MPR4_9ZZZZ
MAIAAWVLGILGGLCAVMGIITAVGVISLLGAELTAMFWLVLSAILLLACVAAAISRSSYE